MDGKREMFIEQNSKDFGEIKIANTTLKRCILTERNFYFSLYYWEQFPIPMYYLQLSSRPNNYDKSA